MTKFFNIFKKPVIGSFLAQFLNFGGKKNFFWKIWLSHTTSYGFLASCQNLDKTNHTIPRKCPDRWKDGRMDRHYFIGPFSLTPEVQ